MKVKCALCGTKFELERNNSICPNCAYHYHVDGESQRSFEGYNFNHNSSTGVGYGSAYSQDSFAKQQMHQEKLENFIDEMKYNYEKNAQSTSYDMHKDIKVATKKEKQFVNINSNSVTNTYNRPANNVSSKKLNKILVGMILTAVIMGVAIFIFALTFIENTTHKEESVVNEYEFIEDTPTYGPVYKNIGFDCGIFEIEEMAIVSDDVWSTLEGYELVSMKYTFQPYGAYASDAAACIDIFIVTHSGHYITPVQTYVLDSDSEIDIYEDIEGIYNVCDDIYYEEGVMYYAVKKNDIASIFINEYDENGEFIESYNITNVEEFITEE